MWILSLYSNIFLLIYLGSSSDIVGSGDYEEGDQTEVTTSVDEINFDANNEDANSEVDRGSKMGNQTFLKPIGLYTIGVFMPNLPRNMTTKVSLLIFHV